MTLPTCLSTMSSTMRLVISVYRRGNEQEGHDDCEHDESVHDGWDIGRRDANLRGLYTGSGFSGGAAGGASGAPSVAAFSAAFAACLASFFCFFTSSRWRFAKA